jgi:hypothetical protein
MVNRLSLSTLLFLTACTTEQIYGDPSRERVVTVKPITQGRFWSRTTFDLATGAVTTTKSKTVTVLRAGRKYRDDGSVRMRER